MTLLSSNGTPLDTDGAQGDFDIDYGGKFLWGPKGASSWANTAQSLVGPTGPPGPPGALPTMTNLASVWGPGAQFAGQTMGTTAGVAAAGFYFNGTPIPHQFTPLSNTALTGLQVTNFSATGATVYFYLQNLTTGQSVFGYNAGNGIASGTVDAKTYGNTAYPLLAGNTYQWQGIRASSGAAYVQINPIYLAPSGTPSSLSTYNNFCTPSAATVAKGGTVVLQTPGIVGQSGYYRNANPSYLYMLEVYMAGSGVADPYFYNNTASANGYVSDNYGYPTLTSSLVRYPFGPFSASTWPFAVNASYTLGIYAPNGSLTISQAWAQVTVAQ